MSERQEQYTVARTPFDLSQAEINLILRLRQHRGMIIVDGDSMCIWPASRMEQCNGRRSKLPFEIGDNMPA
jgi:hypothetical protein